MTCIWTQFLVATLGILVINKEVVSDGEILPYWYPNETQPNARKHLVSRFAVRAKQLVSRKRPGRQGKETHAPEDDDKETEAPHITAKPPYHGSDKKQTEEKDSDNQFLLSPYSIEKQFSQLLSELDTNFTSEIIGRTAHYIDIYLYKIAGKPNKIFRAKDDKFVEDDKKDKKIIFIVHALSPMGLGHLKALTMENYLKKLLRFYVKHLDKFDIYLIPLANPDGYLKVKRDFYGLWNKNASPNSGCPGVNVDRNFDVAWEKKSQVLSSCSQHYAGEEPFSEPESRAVRDVIHHMSHKMVAYFHVHGGVYENAIHKGDAILYPNGFTDIHSNDDKYIDIKGEIDEAIRSANFKVLSVAVDTLYNWYGKVTGTSVDYASKVYGIPYSMELVMQTYSNPFNDQQAKLYGSKYHSMGYYALKEIWGRVIDVLFTNIHKKLQASAA